MARRGELVDGVLPAENLGEIAHTVGVMFNAFPTVKVSGEQFEGILVAYTEQLKHLPLWAVETGCRSAAARNVAFPPNAGELRAICDALLQPYQDEQAAIRKVLEAEVYTPNPRAERERVKAGFKTLLAELQKTSEPFGKRSAARDARDHSPIGEEPTSRPLPILSGAALAKFYDQEPPFSASEDL